MAVDEAKANYFFGRTDVPKDAKEGKLQAGLDAARGTNPERDRTLPWTLLMAGMFSLLYKEAEKEEARRAGRKKRGPRDPFPKPIRITPQEWAKAFNFITTSYINNEFMKKPDKVGEEKLANGRTVALLMIVQDAGKGAAKTRDYFSPERFNETKARLARMEMHRKEIANDPQVKKYLASLRNPAIN